MVHVLLYPAGVYGHEVKLGAYFQFPLIENLLPTFIVAKSAPVNAHIALIWMIWAGLMVLMLQGKPSGFAPGRAALSLLAGLVLFYGAAMAAEAAGPGLLAPRSKEHVLKAWTREARLGASPYRWQATGQPPKRVLELSPVRYRHGKVKLLGDPPSAIMAPAQLGAFLPIWASTSTCRRAPTGSSWRCGLQLQAMR